jgi:integrase
MRLTTSTIATLSLGDGEADRIWFDDEVPGFGLRIRNTGSRTWVYQYKIQRRTRRVVIGKVSAIKLAKAREIAADYHARVRQGGDPVTEKRVQIERASHTFGPLAEQYLERRKTALRPRSWTATALYLQKHAAPLHTLPVDSVNLRTIAGLLGRIEKTTGPVAANRCRAALSSMFSWAMREGLAQSNPTLNTNKREEHPRDHVLTNDEIRHVWAAAEGAYGDIIKLLILTGQRREEIGSLRWSEVNLDRKLISLPRERTKMHARTRFRYRPPPPRSYQVTRDPLTLNANSSSAAGHSADGQDRNKRWMPSWAIASDLGTSTISAERRRQEWLILACSRIS